MLEHKELAAPSWAMGTGIESVDPDVPLDLSKYATAELKLAGRSRPLRGQGRSLSSFREARKAPGNRRKTRLGSPPGVEAMWTRHRRRKQTGHGRAE